MLTIVNVSDKNKSLACETYHIMTYENKKLTIKKIFVDPTADDNILSTKSEWVFLGEHKMIWKKTC